MKTTKLIKKITGSVCLAAALAAGVWTLPIQAAETGSAKGGATDLMNLNRITTQAQAEALKPGDTLAMVCSKCKSVVTHNVTTEKGHIKTMTVGEKHLCPGCGNTITVTGTSKGKHDEVKHTCSKCGDDSAFCCATKPGTGQTKGMEKEKH
jgi:predicted RNA-binding Zn-ribbon protein involved in translation (DUF1610 family)